jgi:hypothetical protein
MHGFTSPKRELFEFPAVTTSVSIIFSRKQEVKRESLLPYHVPALRKFNGNLDELVHSCYIVFTFHYIKTKIAQL